MGNSEGCGAQWHPPICPVFVASSLYDKRSRIDFLYWLCCDTIKWVQKTHGKCIITHETEMERERSLFAFEMLTAHTMIKHELGWPSLINFGMCYWVYHWMRKYKRWRYLFILETKWPHPCQCVHHLQNPLWRGKGESPWVIMSFWQSEFAQVKIWPPQILADHYSSGFSDFQHPRQ